MFYKVPHGVKYQRTIAKRTFPNNEKWTRCNYPHGK